MQIHRAGPRELSFWESEMHKLFCSVFASDVLSLET